MINRIAQLERREKILLLVGAVFIVVVVLIYGVYDPYRNALSRAQRSIATKYQQIDQVRALQAEYLALQGQMNRAESKLVKRSGVSALAMVEDIASRIGSRENLSYIRPQPAQTQGDIHIENLDVKLERLSLQQVLQLLWGVESAKTQMQIKNLRLKQRFDNPAQTDLTMTVSVFRKNR